MMILLVLMVVAVVLLVLIRLTWTFMKKEDVEKSALDMRKKQSTSNFRENALKRKMEKIVEERTKKGKKIKIEEMCMQAGFNLSYGEYRLIGYFLGVILAISILGGLQNVFMAIIFLFIGTLLPGQVIHAIRNKRVSQMEEQVGSFMRLVTERYNSTKDFAKSIQDSTEDFQGVEPMYSELSKTSADINLGVGVSDALKKLGVRTGSKYLIRMADYYEIASDLGTTETRENLLKQSLLQYEEDRSMKAELKNELNGPVREAYMMVAMVPLISLYMANATMEYKEFMLETTLGQLSISVIILVLLGVSWFINKQIGKPLD